MGKLFTQMLPVFLLFFQMFPTLPLLNIIKNVWYSPHCVLKNHKILGKIARSIRICFARICSLHSVYFQNWAELHTPESYIQMKDFSRYLESFILNCFSEYSTSGRCWVITRHNNYYPKINSPIFFSHMIKSPKLRY